MPAGAEEEGFRRALAGLDAQEKGRRRVLHLWATAAVSGWVAFAGMAAWYATHPVIVEQRVVLPLGPGHVSLAMHEPATLPLEVQNDLAKNAVWALVNAVESYSASTEDAAWEIVSFMLAPEIAKMWKDARDPRNKESRAVRFGNRVTIETRLAAPMKDICDATGCPKVIDGYEVPFIRTVRESGLTVEEITYVAYVRFRRGVEGFPPVFADKHNILRIQAWKYDPGRPIGAHVSRFH